MAEQSIFNFTDKLLGSTSLYCVICKDILKPPIILVEHVGNMCSTCHEDKSEMANMWKSMDNPALESILKLLKLPCKYKLKGCVDRFWYADLASHQSDCKFRTKICTMFKYYGCEWEGNAIDFVDHFKDGHGDHVINFENNLFFLETSLTEANIIKLLVTKQHHFILRMQNNTQNNKLFYMICSVSDYSSFSGYSVKHKGSGENYIQTKSKILPSCHIHNDFDENVAVEIDLDALKQVSHISDTIINIFKLKLKESTAKPTDDKLLRFLECPVCKNFMKPPIFQCHTGHSVCSLCRPRLQTCPTCRSIFGNTRNYSLEGLTAHVQYPCIYHDTGCTEIGSVINIVKHESECSCKPYKCPFPNCSTIGNHDLVINHLINLHSDSVSSSGNTRYAGSFRLDPNNGCSTIFARKCLIIANHIFRLTCRRVAEHCLMAAEIFGNRDESKTLVYEVSIIDTKRPERKLIKTDYCLNEMSEEEVLKKSIMFPIRVVSSYSNNGTVTYNFSIRGKKVSS